MITFRLGRYVVDGKKLSPKEGHLFEVLLANEGYAVSYSMLEIICGVNRASLTSTCYRLRLQLEDSDFDIHKSVDGYILTCNQPLMQSGLCASLIN